MAVNTLGIEQVYPLITAIHNQATGNNSLAPTDTSSFISVAQATLRAGYDSVLQAITQVVSKTLIAVRPYSRKFAGLQVDTARWGGIIRKISFADRGPITDPTYILQDGQPVDQFVVRNPEPLETRYVGADVYSGCYTIFTKQLDVAFSGPEEFASFMSGLMLHFSNEREQWLEDLSRGIVVNAMAAKFDINSDIVHLLTEYNTATGQSLTQATVKLAANYGPFIRWCYARIAQVSQQMTERSELFQEKITGYNIYRHTPVQDQKLYMNADFLEHIKAEVLSTTYHNDLLNLADVESVGFWQSIKSPMSINNKPVYIDANGDISVASAAVAEGDIVGILFDRDAMGYCIGDDSLETSPYNAAGQYYNLFSHMRVQLQNDMTEKIVVFQFD